MVFRSDLDKVIYKLKHPDYVGDRYPKKLLRKFTEEQILDKTAVLVMVKGFNVFGYVYDSGGNPVAGAVVYDGQFIPHYSGKRVHNDDLRTKTDAQGMFEFHSVGQRNLFLNVEVEGFAPYANNFAVSAESDPIEIILEKGTVIYGRVVDKNGQPVEGAEIRNDQWSSEGMPVYWESKSDADGRFVWENAPQEQVILMVGKPNYYNAYLTITADPEAEYEFVLYPGLDITGK